MHALLFSLLFSLFSWVAPAQVYMVYQDTIQGGVSIDGQGVSAHDTGWTCSGDLIEVKIPTGSTIINMYAFVHSKSSGFPTFTEGSIADQIKINGHALSNATEVYDGQEGEGAGCCVRVYELDPADFAMAHGPGTYSYCEHNDADNIAPPGCTWTSVYIGQTCTGHHWHQTCVDIYEDRCLTGGHAGFHGGTGVGGTVLAVVYTHPTLTGRRHVALFADYFDGTEHTYSNFPTSGTWGEQVVSPALLWECSNEQTGNRDDPDQQPYRQPHHAGWRPRRRHL
ncbi:MAG: hypothetical protein JRI25_26870 [Deltaproteobacteria bacterium]|nr:hypothetical protein [Deltaproteobacteria bacterium]